MPSESDYMADAIVRAGLPGEVFRAELAAGPVCDYCGCPYGSGWVEVEHPRWGSPSCPEPYIDVPCPHCQPSAHDRARR